MANFVRVCAGKMQTNNCDKEIYILTLGFVAFNMYPWRNLGWYPTVERGLPLVESRNDYANLPKIGSTVGCRTKFVQPSDCKTRLEWYWFAFGNDGR